MEEILKNWKIISAIIAGLVAVVIAIKYKIPMLIKRVTDLEASNKEKISKQDCEMCKDHVCRQIQKVNGKIDEGEKKRDLARTEYDKKFDSLNGTLEYIRGKLDTISEHLL